MHVILTRVDPDRETSAVNARSMVEDQQTFQADRAALDHHGGFENGGILARASISHPGRQTRRLGTK